MKHTVTTLLLAFVLLAGVAGATPAQAEETASTTAVVTTTTTSGSKDIAALLEQIKKLTELFNTLKAKLGAAQTELTALKATLREDLKEGMTADEIKQVQEVLAADPTVYPAGLTTGYFGRMTTEALKKFQTKHGLEVTGELNDETRAALELILEERKASGKIRFEVIAGEGKDKLKERVKAYCTNDDDEDEDEDKPVCTKLKTKYEWDDAQEKKEDREAEAKDAVADAKEEVAEAEKALDDAASVPRAAKAAMDTAEYKLEQAEMHLEKKNFGNAVVFAELAEKAADRVESILEDEEDDEDQDEDDEDEDEDDE